MLVAIGVTVPTAWLTTYAVLPPGVIAIAPGPAPTLIGLPAVSVAVRMGVSVPDKALTTHACRPSGVIAIATGSAPASEPWPVGSGSWHPAFHQDLEPPATSYDDLGPGPATLYPSEQFRDPRETRFWDDESGPAA